MAGRKSTTIQTDEMQDRLTALEDNIHALAGVCKQQSDVIQSIIGTRPSQLENCTENLGGLLSEEDSDMAKNRIRRRVTLNGQQMWITATSEQEYAEKLLKAANIEMEETKSDAPKNNFQEYAQRWFDVFSKPNVETVTATTYARQLRLYLYPAFGEMFVEDIKPSDVQALFNGIDGARETKLKVKMVLNMIFQQAMEDEIIVKNPLASKSIDALCDTFPISRCEVMKNAGSNTKSCIFRAKSIRKPVISDWFNGADGRIRTGDLILTNSFCAVFPCCNLSPVAFKKPLFSKGFEVCLL